MKRAMIVTYDDAKAVDLPALQSRGGRRVRHGHYPTGTTDEAAPPGALARHPQAAEAVVVPEYHA